MTTNARRLFAAACLMCCCAAFAETKAEWRSRVGFQANGVRAEDLRPCGSLSVTRDGAIIEGMDIRGDVEVKAANVVIRSCRIRSDGYWPVRVFPGASLLIECTEIIGTTKAEAAIGVDDGTARYTALRLDIHGSVDGLRASSGSRIEGCYVHDLGVVAGETHNDGIQMLAGDGVLIKDNVIDLPPGCNSTIIIQTDFGPIQDVRIEGNCLNGGAYSIYSRIGNHEDKRPPERVQIIGNRFGRRAVYGLLSVDGTVDSRDNTWADTGAPIASP